MLKNHDLHLRTFCRSLLVCIHDNTAVPPHLMQAVLPTDPTWLLFKTQSGNDSTSLSRDNLGWNKEQRKEKPLRTLGTGYACTELKETLTVIAISKEKTLWLLYFIWCSAFKFTQPSFTSLIAFYSSNNSIFNRIQQKCLSIYFPKE